MQLSDTEKKMVSRLQKQQKSLIRWRWVWLLYAACFLGSGVYFFGVLQPCLDKPDPPKVLILVVALPMVYLTFGLGTWLAIITLVRWNGKPETILLLKLLEAAQNDTSDTGDKNHPSK